MNIIVVYVNDGISLGPRSSSCALFLNLQYFLLPVGAVKVAETHNIITFEAEIVKMLANRCEM